MNETLKHVLSAFMQNFSSLKYFANMENMSMDTKFPSGKIYFFGCRSCQSKAWKYSIIANNHLTWNLLGIIRTHFQWFALNFLRKWYFTQSIRQTLCKIMSNTFGIWITSINITKLHLNWIRYCCANGCCDRFAFFCECSFPLNCICAHIIIVYTFWTLLISVQHFYYSSLKQSFYFHPFKNTYTHNTHL
jgi:hypothetical protein